MLTKESALARLRATGTLATEKRQATILTPAQARDPAAWKVSQLMLANARSPGPRHTAPSVNHLVLP